MRMSRLTLVLLAAVLVESAWLLYPTGVAFVLRYRESPAARGREIARRFGCFSCHGPDGGGGVPNPGSRLGTVPGFGEQTLMMFVKGDSELREYILDGAPARKRKEQSYRDEMRKQVLRMPAFRGWLSRGDVDSLVAYLRAVSGMLSPPDGAAARGAALAQKHACLHCHGPMGTGGQRNAGSFKGYIPGFFGSDFDDLVRSDDELLRWIRDGSIERLRRDPIAEFFLKRQRIHMPAFKDSLTDAEQHDVAAYVRWLAAGSWRNAALK